MDKVEEKIKQITSDFCEVVDKYFVENTTFTVVIKVDDEHPIVISCDNDLGKVIDALKDAQIRQIAGK